MDSVGEWRPHGLKLGSETQRNFKLACIFLVCFFQCRICTLNWLSRSLFVFSPASPTCSSAEKLQRRIKLSPWAFLVGGKLEVEIKSCLFCYCSEVGRMPLLKCLAERVMLCESSVRMLGGLHKTGPQRKGSVNIACQVCLLPLHESQCADTYSRPRRSRNE